MEAARLEGAFSRLGLEQEQAGAARLLNVAFQQQRLQVSSSKTTRAIRRWPLLPLLFLLLPRVHRVFARCRSSKFMHGVSAPCTAFISKDELHGAPTTVAPLLS